MPMTTKKARLAALFGIDSHVTRPKEERPVAESDGDDYAYGRLRGDILQMILRMPRSRTDRYALLDDLDEGIAASVLDLYTEETTQPIRESKPQVPIIIKSENKAIEKEGNALLNKLGISSNPQPLMRVICKYGDLFYRLFYSGEKGIEYGYIIKNPGTVSREESDQKVLTGFKQVGVRFEKGKEQSDPWDYVHFANLLHPENFPYGTAILSNSYRSLRQIILSEDSVLLYRLIRHPDRLYHVIDTGDADEVEQRRQLRRYASDFRRSQNINPSVGTMTHRHAPMTPLEDIFIAIGNQNVNTKIDKLPGSSNAFEVYDLDYYINKFFSEVRVPKAFLGFEGDINARATLTSQSIRFARAVIHMQSVLKKGIKRLLMIHYTLLTKSNTDQTYKTDEDGSNFNIEMCYTSGLAELDWISLMLQRSEYAQTLYAYADNPYIDNHAMLNYLFRDILKLKEDDISKIVLKSPVYPVPPKEQYPNISNMRKARVKGVTPQEQEYAKAIVKSIPFNSFVDEIQAYLEDVKQLHIESNRPVTPIDPRSALPNNSGSKSGR